MQNLLGVGSRDHKVRGALGTANPRVIDGCDRVLTEERSKPDQDIRQGKRLIKYDGSEAMALAVLENQCAWMQKYKLDLKVKGQHSDALNAQSEMIKRSMRNWCETVLEEHEVVMAHRAGAVTDGVGGDQC